MLLVGVLGVIGIAGGGCKARAAPEDLHLRVLAATLEAKRGAEAPRFVGDNPSLLPVWPRAYCQYGLVS